MTPARSLNAVVPIAVLPPSAAATSEPTAPPSSAEACAIVRAITPEFKRYADRYDTKKCPPAVYERVRERFCRPVEVTADTLREAILWKYGHLGKPAIPPAHEALISQIQHGWSKAVASLPRSPEDAFVALDREFGGKTPVAT